MCTFSLINQLRKQPFEGDVGHTHLVLSRTSLPGLVASSCVHECLPAAVRRCVRGPFITTAGQRLGGSEGEEAFAA